MGIYMYLCNTCKALRAWHIEISQQVAATVDRGKKSHNQKVESYLLFGDFSEYYSLRDSLSDSPEELFQTGKGGARIHTSFCWKKRNPASWTSYISVADGGQHSLFTGMRCVCVLSHVQLFATHGFSLPGFSVHGISWQEYWSGLPFPSPGDLPNPEIEPVSLVSSAFAGKFFATNATWEAGNFFFFLVHMLWFEPQYPLPGIPTSFPTTFFWVRSCGAIFVFNFVGSLSALISAATMITEGILAFPQGMLDFHVQLQRWHLWFCVRCSQWFWIFSTFPGRYISWLPMYWYHSISAQYLSL